MDSKQYDWQVFNQAVHALISAGDLGDRLRYARDAIHKLDLTQVQIQPDLQELYRKVRDATSRLPELNELEQKDLATNILTYYMRVSECHPYSAT